MHVFGLTGGIASGKSTVGQRFRARGLPVVDADVVAREVVAPGSTGLAALVTAFGSQVLQADGALDRAALSLVIFSDPQMKRQLEAITHPLIAAASQRRIMALTGEGHLVACYEAALLVETGQAPFFKPLVVVASSEHVQIARIIARDGLGTAAATLRVHAQKPLAEKLALATYVIWNDDDREVLMATSDNTLNAITDSLNLPRFPCDFPGFA